MGYKNTTFSIDENTIKDLKQLALDKETSQKELVNQMLIDGIKKEKGQTKLD